MAQAVRTITTLAAAGMIATLAAPAAGQVKPGSQTGLGLTGADIPPILKTVQADPYRAPAEPACQSIPQEILALDAVLGPDVDGPRSKTGVTHMAVNYARGMIPYRGVVRFVLRSDSKDKALQAAATAGVARRGFLRGLGAQLHCAPEAEPAAQTAEAPDLTNSIPAFAVVADRAPTPKPLPPAPPAEPAAEPIVKLMLVAAPTPDATPAEVPAQAADAPAQTAASEPRPDPASPPGR